VKVDRNPTSIRFEACLLALEKCDKEESARKPDQMRIMKIFPARRQILYN